MVNQFGFYEWYPIWKNRMTTLNGKSITRTRKLIEQGFDLGHASITIDPTKDNIDWSLVGVIRDNLHDARREGLGVILKFKPGDEVTDAPTERILKQIDQLKDLLYDCSDAIVTLQAGFIGHYGEFHSSVNNNSSEARETVARALFENTPKNMIISFRTAEVIEELLKAGALVPGRVGFHHDALWAPGSSEMGTWTADRDKEMAMLRYVCSVFGGECAIKEDDNGNPILSEIHTSLNRIAEEMDKIPYSYISGNWNPAVTNHWRAMGWMDPIKDMMQEDVIQENIILPL